MNLSFEDADHNTQITRLESHAAVRLDTVSDRHFDRHGLPVRRKMKRSKRSVFMKSVKRLASYLTMRLNPSYQESHVLVVESFKGLTFEVRTVVGGSEEAKVVFSVPLSRLVDVTGDSVIEKDTVVFSQLPETYDAVNNSQIQPKKSKKGEIISDLFSAYGEIGLILIFKTQNPALRRTAASAAARSSYTKVGLRFVTAEDRNQWLSFCAEAYIGLLLDSIRTGRDSLDLEAPESAGEKDEVEVEEPPLAAVDKYIDFFLAHTPSKLETEMESGVDCITTEDVPCGGQLRVGPCGTKGKSCRVAVERVIKHNESGKPVAEEFLVLTPSSFTRVLRRIHRKKMQLKEIKVYAEKEDDGTTFFIERTITKKDHIDDSSSVTRDNESSGQEDSLQREADKGASNALFMGGGHTKTLECHTDSYTDRKKWLLWMESVLHRPTIYLESLSGDAEGRKARAKRSSNTFLGAESTW